MISNLCAAKQSFLFTNTQPRFAFETFFLQKINLNKMTKPKVIKKSSTAAKHKIVANDRDGKSLGPAATTLLNVLAVLVVGSPNNDSIKKSKLQLMAEIKGKSTFANAQTKLKNAGFILVEKDTVFITSSGMGAATIDAANINIPATNAALHDATKEKHKLNAKQIALFDHLANGGTYNKKEVQVALGINASSTWANLMTSLKKLEIVEYDRETIRLTDAMFEIEGRPEM